MMNEEWRDVVDFPRYQVSNHGRIRRGGRILKPSLRRNGYRVIQLFKNKKQHSKKVSHLVAAAFIGPLPPGFLVHHKDRISINDIPGNLEYMEIKKHAKFHYQGIAGNGGETHPSAKLSNKEVIEIRQFRKDTGLSYAKISKIFNVSSSTIGRIVSRTGWKKVL
jgi:NUMOD4 motif/HNH endonuclease